MFKYLERWKKDWQQTHGQGLDFVDPDSWEALRARIWDIHGRKQDGTPDRRTRQGKAWTDADLLRGSRMDAEPEPEAEFEAESESQSVYATLLNARDCGALHEVLQGLHEEVLKDRNLPDGRRQWDESRPELIEPPKRQDNPSRDWRGETEAKNLDRSVTAPHFTTPH